MTNHQVRRTFTGVALAACLFTLVGCSSDSQESAGDDSPTRQGQVVQVTGHFDSCQLDPSVISPGTISFRGHTGEQESVTIFVYGPENGEFNVQLLKLSNIDPGSIKVASVALGTGAYEVECQTGGRNQRSRLTVL